MAKPTYVVTAPYITAVTSTHDGPKLLGFYAGATLPDDMTEESIKHHLALGMIAKSADAEKELAAQPEEPADGLGTLKGVDQPKGGASRDEWVAYATYQAGATAEELEGLTRDQIRDSYAK